MIALHALVLLAVLSASNQAVLLDFHSPSCGPCRSMEPTIRRLAADGYPVRTVNVEQDSSLARQFRVDRVPTYVLVVDGREAGRAVGPTSYNQLAGMFAAARPAAGNAAPVHPVAARSNLAAPPTPPAVGMQDPKARAMAATVRLCIEDAGGRSFGSGTIIDVFQNEALVMTCGHLFRESRGQGRMSVDLFPPGAASPVQGEVLTVLMYDLEQDVALVAIRPNCAVTPVPVAATDYPLRPGDPVFSIGCDQGAAPSLRDSRITSLNKYLGPPNIQSSGQPVIGRSGGGLFSACGQLIGVCNLADPQDDEGIYAALPLLHANLDKIGQSRIYQRNANPAAVAQAEPGPAPPQMPQQMPSGPLGGPAAPAAVVPDFAPAPLTAAAAAHVGPGPAAGIDDDTEVICIVRSRRDPRGQSQIFYLDRPSPSLLERLAQEAHPAPTGEPVTLQASRDVPPPSRADGQTNSPVVRGQAY